MGQTPGSKFDTIEEFNNALDGDDQLIVNTLKEHIDAELPAAQSKIWHRHPVWFLDGNPIVGYSKQKAGIRLMFWSGADFQQPALNVRGEKFKDASIFYNNVSEISIDDLKNWLALSKSIQWDYKNLVKRKGQLVKLT